MSMLVSLLTLSIFSFSKTLTTVSVDQFSVGASWSWAYSEYDVKNKVWNPPYLFEKYTVVEAQGSKVTIEMASGATYPVTSAAHHKFVADVEKCLTALSSYKSKKPWSIAFYTKSYGPEWELVSTAHKNLAFTEKFNCVRELPDAVVLDSVYIESEGPLAGVAASKAFDINYKFELVESPL